MERRLKSLMLIFVLLLFACKPGAEKRRDAFFEKGKEQFKAGNYAQATVELKNALKIDPNFADGRHLLGLCYVQEPELDQTNLNKAACLDLGLLLGQFDMEKLFIEAEANATGKEETKPAQSLLRMDAEHPRAEVAGCGQKGDQAEVGCLEKAVTPGHELLEQAGAFEAGMKTPENSIALKALESAVVLFNGNSQDVAVSNDGESSRKRKSGALIIIASGLIGLLGFRMRSPDEE